MRLNNILVVTLILSIILVAGCTKETQITTSQTTIMEEIEETETTTTIEEVKVSEVKEFDMIAKQWEFIPATIIVNKGDTVRLHVKSIDVTHGFGLSGFGINEVLQAGEVVDIEFVAYKKGTFSFACTIYCGSGHSHMDGQLIVN